MNTGGYPPGAEHDPNAPYNEHQEPERDFEVTCTQTLSKIVDITTDNYTHCVEEEYEEGNRFYNVYDDTSGTDWKEEFYNNDYHDPLALINLFKEFLQEQLEKGNYFKSQAFTKILIEECEGWEEDDFDVYRD